MKNPKRNSFRKISGEWYVGCILLDAMKHGELKDVLLISRSRHANPNVLLPEYGITPMHCAAGIEPEELGVRCIEEFLKNRGDPNVQCHEGITPVHVASCWCRLKVLTVLIKQGGNPYIADDEGNDAFYYAKDNKEVLKLLSSFQNHEINDEKETCGSKQEQEENCRFEILTPDGKLNDLELDSKALSLMIKHRQNVIIFESLPEDDSSSTASSISEFKDDFTFEPNTEHSKKINDSEKLVYDDIESSAESCELYPENIFDSDKTRVIQVINDNVKKAYNAAPTISKFEENIEKNDSITKRTGNGLNDPDFYNNEPVKNNANQMAGTTNTSKSINVVEKTCDIEALSHTSLLNTKTDFEKNIYSYKDVTSKSNKIMRIDPVKQFSVSSESNCRLPKTVGEKLVYFRVNTHYRTRTRVFRLTSRSGDGLKTKKGLYTTGYEFWSTKLKNKRCYTYFNHSRKNSKDI